MADQRHPTMDELERMLAALPDQVRFPPTPDIAARIPETLPARRPALLRRRTIWYAAAVLAALLVLTAALPGPRRAVADFFGLPGIRIEFLDREDAEPEAPSEIGSALLFGERTTLDEARDAVPFPIVLPRLDPERSPDEVYVRETDGTTVVSLLYLADERLPEIGTTGVGLLLMEIGSTGGAPDLSKRAMGDGSFFVTSVGGHEAYWIENGELVMQPPDLGVAADSPGYRRRSGNVLIWSDGRVTYRLETMLDRASAVRIAESLAPDGAGTTGNQPPSAVVLGVSGDTRAGHRRTARMAPHEAKPGLPRRRARFWRDARSGVRCRRLGHRRAGEAAAGGHLR